MIGEKNQSMDAGSLLKQAGNFFQCGWNRAKAFASNTSRKIKVGIAVATVAVMSSEPAQAAIVAYDDVTGAVTFDPSDLVEPVIVGVVAAIGATVALVVITWGIKKVYGALKRSS